MTSTDISTEQSKLCVRHEQFFITAQSKANKMENENN